MSAFSNQFRTGVLLSGVSILLGLSGHHLVIAANSDLVLETTQENLTVQQNQFDSGIFSDRPPATQLAQSYRGKASWYGKKFHGRPTASGEIYNSNAMTAAHRSLPFGTRVKVTNLNNGRSVVVPINDRGPFIKGRIIDVSAGAARSLGMIQSGIANVQVEILGR